jgi:hypothetical protein
MRLFVTAVRYSTEYWAHIASFRWARISIPRTEYGSETPAKHAAAHPGIKDRAVTYDRGGSKAVDVRFANAGVSNAGVVFSKHETYG